MSAKRLPKKQAKKATKAQRPTTEATTTAGREDDLHARLEQAIDRLGDAPEDEAQRRRAEAAYRLLTDEGLDPAASVVLDVARAQEADRRWNERIGPFLTRTTVAELLGISKQAVAKRRDLLAIPTDDGWAYPTWQFVGRRSPDRFDEVLEVLPSEREPLLVAAWLTTPTRVLDEDTPMRRIRAGDVEPVVRAAKAYAAGLNR